MKQLDLTAKEIQFLLLFFKAMVEDMTPEEIADSIALELLNKIKESEERE